MNVFRQIGAGTVTAAVIAGAGLPATASDGQRGRAAVARMSMKEFRRAHGAGRLFVIDVRSPKSYQAGHIPGAVNVPLADTARRAAEVRAQAGNRRIVTYCSCPTEHLSTEAAVELAKHGVMNVSALVGGYLDWVAGGGRVERSSDLPFGLVVEKPLQRVLINAYCSPMTVWSVETMRIGPR